MPRFRFRVLLLAAVLPLNAGCKAGPDVTVCVLDPVNASLQCSDASGNATTLPIESAENFVCFSPGDIEKLLHACTQARGL